MVKNNKFVFEDRIGFEMHMSRYADGTELEMTVKKKYKKRTSGQPGEETNFNGYLWGIVYKMIGDEMGELDLDYIHYWMQIAVGNVIVMKDGTKVPRGTKEMSGAEFADYCSAVRIWAATPQKLTEYGMNIPEPNE